MSKTNYDFEAGMISAPIIIALFAGSIIYNAFFAQLVWNWFMPALGVQKISLALAIGLSCVVTMFFGQRGSRESSGLGELIFLFLKGPLAALIGFIALHWL